MDLITIFNKIRDIPLTFPKGLDEEDKRCWGKHRKLFALLNNVGLKVRYRICEFNWSKQRFPPNILSLVKQDLDYHLFLEAQINDIEN
jgi:hypothetical protein